MYYLLFVTLLWAFSFSLIGEYLAGQVDSDFAVLSRIVLAGLVFLPLTRWRGVAPGFIVGMLLVGVLQFGITYLCLYRSFALLSVPEVLLFTVLTPLYVTLVDDALRRSFNPWALLAAGVAVLGAAIIRYDDVGSGFWLGFLLLQVANATFAAGQVLYRHLVARYPSPLPLHRRFGYFYLGALGIALPSFLLFGDGNRLPVTALHWWVLLWLGLAASGLGMFWWNKGATLVDAGTLAVMNNALVPAGLLVNLLLWNQQLEWLRLMIGGGVILLSLWINAWGRRVCGRRVLQGKQPLQADSR